MQQRDWINSTEELSQAVRMGVVVVVFVGVFWYFLFQFFPAIVFAGKINFTAFQTRHQLEENVFVGRSLCFA